LITEALSILFIEENAAATREFLQTQGACAGSHYNTAEQLRGDPPTKIPRGSKRKKIAVCFGNNQNSCPCRIKKGDFSDVLATGILE
jgi:hypothetical protein